jgi:hypothetical protein
VGNTQITSDGGYITTTVSPDGLVTMMTVNSSGVRTGLVQRNNVNGSKVDYQYDSNTGALKKMSQDDGHHNQTTVLYNPDGSVASRLSIVPDGTRTRIDYRSDGSTITTIVHPDASYDIIGSGANITASNGDRLTASSDTINVAANSTATITGNNNMMNAGSSDTLTASGNSDMFVFQPAFDQDVINGFNSTDSMQFSASDFANWSALLSHVSQSGSNTVITLDASDTITLKGVTASSLQSSQFSFK